MVMAVALAAALAAGCAGPAEQATRTPSDAPPSAAATPPSSSGPVAPVAAADVITGLTAPWSMAFLDDSSVLVSLRDSGEVLLLTRSGTTWSSRSAGTVPGVVHDGEGGLLGLAIAPAGDAVYAMFTSRSDNRVVRMAWDGSRLGAPDAVATGIPRAGFHNGGRIAFGPDGALYIATGDAGRPEAAQDRSSLAGKILRVAADGSVPGDNPFPGSPVYSLGHRNVQGLAFDDAGRLWASEFGAKDVDEINLIAPGANYGWPIVEGAGGRDGLVDPVVTWSPTSVASPSGLAYASGSLWVASLRGKTLYQVPVAGTTAFAPVAHFSGTYGRLRDAAASPSGSLWIMTNNTDGRGQPVAGDDRIIEVRLQPAR